MNLIADQIVKSVNNIHYKGLNHRWVLSILDDMESEHHDVSYYNSLLSVGRMLRKTWELQEEIPIFLEMKEANIEVKEHIACD